MNLMKIILNRQQKYSTKKFLAISVSFFLFVIILNIYPVQYAIKYAKSENEIDFIPPFIHNRVLHFHIVSQIFSHILM